MEMHQIRYFLAAARTLNFTRASEECHVSQPALTRAVKLLEDELGGELFRRERNLTHLSDLGERMLPFMQRCFDSAIGAANLAKSFKRGEIATLRLALSRTVDIVFLMPFLSELVRAMDGLELKVLRGTVQEISEIMKEGGADLAIAGSMLEPWERLDARALFNEGFLLLTYEGHRFWGKASVDIVELQSERVLRRTYCEMAEQISSHLKSENGEQVAGHDVGSERDLIALLENRLGVAIVPRSTSVPVSIGRVPMSGLDLERTIFLYTVAGRPYSSATATLIKQLQAADWSQAAA